MKLAIVVPRYGDGIAGGAEVQARGFAEESVRWGWHVEVWTTCVKDHYSWKNECVSDSETLRGVLIRRFPVMHIHPSVHESLQAQIATNTLKAEDSYRWLYSGPHSPGLYEHISKHAASFDAIIVLPYATSLMQTAAWVAPDNTILWPCLHDEVYAYMPTTRLLMESVWGVMFNTREEMSLAINRVKSIPKRYTVLGEGVIQASHTNIQSEVVSPEYLLYMGRLEEGKNLSEVYDYMQQYYENKRNIKLVILGKGPYLPPAHPAFDFRGFVTDDEKMSIASSAIALCQPSLNESFSLTIMESWLANRPVLVHNQCQVTRGHVLRSNGGLLFESYEEFEETLEWFIRHPEQAQLMGRNGNRYVRANYLWSTIVKRFEKILADWQSVR